MTNPNPSKKNNAPPRPVTQDWVRFRAVGYLTGRGLAFGVGDDIFPRVATAPGKFSLNMDLIPQLNPNISVCDGRFDIFEEDKFDHVVIGPSIGACPDPGGIVRQVVSKLRMGGHVVLYLKKHHVFKDVPTLFQFEEDALTTLLEQSGAWRLKYQDVRGDDMLVIAKKVAGKRGTMLPIKPRAAKRACIVRYGALGDMVMITPLIRALHEDGYEVTMNITPYAAPIIENNPYVNNIVFQEREAIPNKDLGPYWKEWEKEYDRYINLSESIEGKLLKVENRHEFYTSSDFRRRTCGSTNYYDHTMNLGGYPERTGQRGELFFSPAERKDAARVQKEFGDRFVIAWGLNGSSHHKLYPLTQPVLETFLAKHPDVIVALLGGPEAEAYEFDHPQVIRTCGKWPLRQTLAFIALVADAAVGPESMMINVAACYDKPKITFLSHSSHDNLCKYWTNDFCLTPDTTMAPCYPCHQLHYTLESCPIGQIRDAETNEVIAQGPLCAMGAISMDKVLSQLEYVYEHFSSPTQQALVTV